MASSQLAHRRRFFLVRNRFLAFGPRVCSSGPVATLSVATDLRQLRVPHPPRFVRRVGFLTLFFAFRVSLFDFHQLKKENHHVIQLSSKSSPRFPLPNESRQPRPPRRPMPRLQSSLPRRHRIRLPQLAQSLRPRPKLPSPQSLNDLPSRPRHRPLWAAPPKSPFRARTHGRTRQRSPRHG